jgi:integrase/recombinase XerD
LDEAMSERLRAGAAFEKVAREHIGSRGSPDTRTIYLADLARWVLFCQLGGYDVDKPSLEATTAFRDDLKDKLADATVRRILSALSKMYAVAVARQVVEWNPFDVNVLARPEKDEAAGSTAAFSKEQAEAIISAAAGQDVLHLRDRTIMRLLYDMGLRVSEVAKLKRSEVLVRADGVCVIYTKVKKKGKVANELPASTAEALNAWLAIADESPWVFSHGRSHISRKAIGARIAYYGKLAGIKGASPHWFRATFISDALDVLPLHDVQAIVHHADPKTTLKYDRHKRGAGGTSAVAKARGQR